MQQLFQTSTKLNQFKSLEITVTSSNLFSAGAVEIFRQSYTLQELRELNNSSVYLSAKKPNYSSDYLDLGIEEFSTIDKGVNHYVMDPVKDTDESKSKNEYDLHKYQIEDEFDKGDIESKSNDEMDHQETPSEVIFTGPPPKNTRIHSQKSIELRKTYRPSVNPCQGASTASMTRQTVDIISGDYNETR